MFLIESYLVSSATFYTLNLDNLLYFLSGTLEAIPYSKVFILVPMLVTFFFSNFLFN